jgi:D-alanyl-D-alanine carboxypeptidase/D-alanyl-D-alanine-endopeptidase (penicillin-binding protein 4)
MVRVLAHDYYSKDSQTFMASLSIGGVDGTLKRRFEGDMRGRVLGKSGFVAGVSALSGYLHAKDGHWYAFSILMNGIPELSNSSIKPLQERIIRALDKSVSH